MGTGRKIVLIIGIIIILFLVFSVVYDISQPNSKESLNVIEADKNVQEGANLPYQVKILYDGNWYGKMGDPNYLQEKSGNGEKIIGLDCASWDQVSIFVQKDDSSSSNLTVQLLRNGKVVAENSTTSSYGTVSFSYKV